MELAENRGILRVTALEVTNFVSEITDKISDFINFSTGDIDDFTTTTGIEYQVQQKMSIKWVLNMETR